MKTITNFRKVLVLFALFGCLLPALASGQTENETSNVTPVQNTSVSITAQGLFVAYELPLFHQFTVEGRAGFCIPVGYATGTIYPTIGYVGYEYKLGHTTADGLFMSVHPSVKVTPRLYYNLKKRASKQKNTSMNSGGFLGLSAAYAFNPIATYNADGNSLFAITPHWGLRRVVKDWFLFEFAGGTSYNINSKYNTKEWSLFIDVRLGYIF